MRLKKIMSLIKKLLTNEKDWGEKTDKRWINKKPLELHWESMGGKPKNPKV